MKTTCKDSFQSHLQYWRSSPIREHDPYPPSETRPNQGYRPKEAIARLQAGAPISGMRTPIYIDPRYGVDPLARIDIPIEDMAEIAQSSRGIIDRWNKQQREQNLITPDTAKIPEVKTEQKPQN